MRQEARERPPGAGEGATGRRRHAHTALHLTREVRSVSAAAEESALDHRPVAVRQAPTPQVRRYHDSANAERLGREDAARKENP